MAGASEPKRILLLHSFGRDFSPWSEYAKIVRAELDRNASGPLDIYEASLTTARFADGNVDEPFVEYLRSLSDKRKLDLIVTIGGPAAGFFQQYSSQIAPSTPILFMALEHRRVPTSLGSNQIALAHIVDFAKVVENILQILPETNSISVVVGNSPIEKFWLGQLREALRPFSSRVAFTWLNELSLEDILTHSAKLPPKSAIFFFVMSVDAAGVPHEGDKTLRRLHDVANAPLFSYTDVYMGKGIVGGPLISIAEVGRKAADIALRILNGETPNGRIEPVRFGPPKFDWREMKRWNISEASLPEGSTIEFREPTLFEQYRSYIIAIVAVCLTQAAIITALWFERIYRRRAERVAQDFGDRLITVQEDERSRLARELHDDITQRLAALAIEAGSKRNQVSGQGSDATMRGIREGLVKLSEDVHALSYRLHPSILDDLGLAEALNAECERFSRLEKLPVEVKIGDHLAAPSPQISLCLFRIAQEALRNISRHARASLVEVSLQESDGGFRISICDDGVGFDPKLRRERVSLGLESMRQRIYLLGGKLTIKSSPGLGTTVLAWAPAEEQLHESPARAFG